MSELAKTQDPLERKDDEKKASYYRGYFLAEKRRQVVDHDPTWGQLIFSGILTALPIVAMYYLFVRMNRVAGEVVKPGAKPGFFASAMRESQKMMDPLSGRNFRVEIKDTKFKHVIGSPEALSEVQQYVDFLRDPTRFTRLGGRLPKGCLLTGEPGTGKTMLARAVAGEANVPFFTCSGADFIEVYSGSGPKRVRELFNEAKAAAPSVIFIDEIDAVGARGNHQNGGGMSGEENRTVNQVLAEMDGLMSSEAVIIFAATNFPDNLDKAMLREGRFDRKVELPMPDREAREDLFKHYLKRIITGDPDGYLGLPSKSEETPRDAPPPTEPTGSDAASVAEAAKVRQEKIEADTKAYELALTQSKEVADSSVKNSLLAARVAALTPGVSPATVNAIVNEAALAAAVANEKRVGLKQLLPAIDDVLVGKKHRSRMTDSASARVALHEAGHTLVGWLLPQQSDVIKVTIVPRGGAGGFTQFVGREKLDMATDRVFFTDICVALGGRIAECTRHDNLTAGAQDDLQRATKNALQQFLAFGMSGNVGLLAFDYNRLDAGRMYQHASDAISTEAEAEAQMLVAAAMKYTTKLVEDNKEKLFAIADALVEKKELLQEDIERLIGPRPPLTTAALAPEAEAALAYFLQRTQDVAIAADRDGGAPAANTTQQMVTQ